MNALCVRLLDRALEDATRERTGAAAVLPAGLLDTIEREWADAVVGCLLFGSAARGRATDRSDVDLLVVLHPGQSIERSLYDRWDALVRARKQPDDHRVSPQF